MTMRAGSLGSIHVNQVARSHFMVDPNLALSCWAFALYVLFFTDFVVGHRPSSHINRRMLKVSFFLLRCGFRNLNQRDKKTSKGRGRERKMGWIGETMDSIRSLQIRQVLNQAVSLGSSSLSSSSSFNSLIEHSFGGCQNPPLSDLPSCWKSLVLNHIHMRILKPICFGGSNSYACVGTDELGSHGVPQEVRFLNFLSEISCLFFKPVVPLALNLRLEKWVDDPLTNPDDAKGQ